MVGLESRILAVMKADATLTALVPATSMQAGEVWLLPADAPFPCISFASAWEGPGGPANEPATSRNRLTFWIESKLSRYEAAQIADRVVFLFNRKEVSMNAPGTVGVYLCKLAGSPNTLREPKTGAVQITINFDLITQ